MTKEEFDSLTVGSIIRKRGTGTWYRVVHVERMEKPKPYTILTVAVATVMELTISRERCERYEVAKK